MRSDDGAPDDVVEDNIVAEASELWLFICIDGGEEDVFRGYNRVGDGVATIATDIQ